MQNVVCFSSDFGLEDTWVGVCHAVILRACPDAVVVDLGHQIPPFDIRKGAALAAAGVYQLPDATHLVVVDPGVGGGRRDLCIVTNGGTRLVGPDNGVLLPAARRAGGVAESYSIDAAKVGFRSPLATFHARDVLAPAAAALVCGVQPSSLGDEMSPEDLVDAPFDPCRFEAGYIVSEIVDIDRFGSVRTGIAEAELAELDLGSRIELSFGHVVVDVPLGSTFSDVEEGDPVALVDSSGWLTLAVRLGSAAERYGLEAGATARVRARG